MSWRKVLDFLRENGILIFLLVLVSIAVIYGFVHPQTHESWEYQGQEAPESGN